LNALVDVAVADRDAVNVDHYLGRHDEHEVAVAEGDRHVKGGLADDRLSEVDDYVSVGCFHGQPPRHNPLPVPSDVAMSGVQLDELLGGRHRGCYRSGNGRQVVQENFQLPVRSCGQRRLKPLVQFLRGEPPVPGRNPQLLHDLVAVLMRRAQVLAIRHQFSSHSTYCMPRPAPKSAAHRARPPALAALPPRIP
jgi:hypothetical protein